MVFPYGAIITVAGLISLLFGVRAAAAPVIGAGLAMEVAAGLSLKQWRAGTPSRFITVASAGEFYTQ